jgi:hypothetical protein
MCSAVARRLGELHYLVGVFDVGQHHQKLIAADATHDVVRPDTVLYPLGDDPQQLVPAGVSEPVVDLLEEIQPHAEIAGDTINPRLRLWYGPSEAPVLELKPRILLNSVLHG